MTKPPQAPRLLAVDGVAERLGVSTKPVRPWIADGELHAHRLGRQLRISEADLSAYLLKNRR